MWLTLNSRERSGEYVRETPFDRSLLRMCHMQLAYLTPRLTPREDNEMRDIIRFYLYFSKVAITGISMFPVFPTSSASLKRTSGNNLTIGSREFPTFGTLSVITENCNFLFRHWPEWRSIETQNDAFQPGEVQIKILLKSNWAAIILRCGNIFAERNSNLRLLTLRCQSDRGFSQTQSPVALYNLSLNTWRHH